MQTVSNPIQTNRTGEWEIYCFQHIYSPQHSFQSICRTMAKLFYQDCAAKIKQNKAKMMKSFDHKQNFREKKKTQTPCLNHKSNRNVKRSDLCVFVGFTCAAVAAVVIVVVSECNDIKTQICQINPE